MSRSHQVIGLCRRAQQYIDDYSQQHMDYDGVVECAFGGGVVLHLKKYKLDNGTVITECIQDEPWSSGPMTFTAFKDDSGKWVKETLWVLLDKGHGEYVDYERGEYWV